MLRWPSLVAVLLLVVSAHAKADDFDRALKAGGLTRADLRFDALDLAQVGIRENLNTKRGPAYSAMHDDPLRIPFYSETYRAFALKNKSKPYDLTVFGLQKIGLGLRRALVGDPTTRLANISITQSLRAIYKLGGQEFSTVQSSGIEQQIKTWPETFRKQFGFLLALEVQAAERRQRAFKKVGALTELNRIFRELIAFKAGEGEDDLTELSPTFQNLISSVDDLELAVGGIDLIFGVDKVITELKKEKWPENISLSLKTPLGEIRVSSKNKNDLYKDEDYFLILDLRGNDNYLAGGGTRSAKNPVSVLIDLEGNDQYLAESSMKSEDVYQSPKRKLELVKPKFGAGVLGYGILYDLAGNDIYRSFRETEGRGRFGMGWLIDLAGDDEYSAWLEAQGSADDGFGLLLDIDGSDKYQTFQKSQGFGGSNAVGLLFDFGEQNDFYLANDSQLDFPSPIDPKHNTSMSQGFALGRRADISDGHSRAGGFGGLFDEGGDNKFICGFFCQGASYWYGVGWLSAGLGNDNYEAVKYAQGAGVHFGVGILHENGGSESYKLGQELGLGEGHDYGVGFLIEESGDDKYEAQNLSLGSASGQGMGFFWDKTGRDNYLVSGPEVLGAAALRVETPTIRTISKTIGIFIDGKGPNKIKSDLKVPEGNSSQTWRHSFEGKNTFGLGVTSDEGAIENPK